MERMISLDWHSAITITIDLFLNTFWINNFALKFLFDLYEVDILQGMLLNFYIMY